MLRGLPIGPLEKLDGLSVILPRRVATESSDADDVRSGNAGMNTEGHVSVGEFVGLFGELKKDGCRVGELLRLAHPAGARGYVPEAGSHAPAPRIACRNHTGSPPRVLPSRAIEPSTGSPGPTSAAW